MSNYGHWDTGEFGEFNPDDFWGFIYEIEEIATGRSYIGKKQFRFKRKKTKSNPSKTKESDWREYTSSSVPLQEAIESQGKDKFTFRILSLCSGRCQLTYEENQLQFSRDVLRAKLPNGERKYFNKTIGHLLFAGVEKQTEAARVKISAFQKIRPVEERRRIADLITGRKHSEASRANMSRSQMGREVTQETRDKLSKTLMGHEVTKESRTKMSTRTYSRETRDKMSKAKIGKARLFTTEHRAKIAATKLVNKHRKLLDKHHKLC
jgi:hypothetical protein